MTLQKCWDFYTRERLSLVADRRRAEAAWRGIERHIGADLPVSKLTQEVVNRYAFNRKVSSSTARRDLTVLRSILQWARKTSRLPVVPHFVIPKESKPRIRWLTPVEIHNLMEAAPRHGLDLFVYIMLATGQRPGAVRSLRWEQINFQAGVIDFHDYHDALKSRRKERGIVPMTPELVARLQPIAQSSGQVLDDEGFRYRWARCVKDANLPGITPHVLRHSVATNLCRAGVPIPEISKLLGHKSTAITEAVYITFTPDYCRRAVSTMSEVLNEKP